MTNTGLIRSINAGRMASIDAFRGLTILLMIFANDVAGVTGIPQWLKHMPTEADAMTFVDVIFPAFLFIVGLAIPFSFTRRMERGQTSLHIFSHVVVRTVGLLIIGVFMVNMPADSEATGMRAPLWALLVYLCIIVLWNFYPETSGMKQIALRFLRILAVAGLAYLAMIYRGEADGKTVIMRHQWWGILGLIGWAYLVASIAYLVFRRHEELVMGTLGLLVLLFVADATGALVSVPWLSAHVNVGSAFGTHGAIAISGVLVGMQFFDIEPESRRPASRIRWMLVFGVGLALAGFMLRPKYGISKNLGTPAWALLSSAICCVLFAALYWVMDVRGKRKWAVFVRPAGENALLAYILAPIVYNIFRLIPGDYLSKLPHDGTAGIARSAVFALVIVGITGLLGRLGVRVRL